VVDTTEVLVYIWYKQYQCIFDAAGLIAVNMLKTINQSIDRSIDRSIGRSVGRSVGASFGAHHENLNKDMEWDYTVSDDDVAQCP